MFSSVPLKVKQYVVILSWQFDTHVKESRNFTVLENFLSGTPPQNGGFSAVSAGGSNLWFAATNLTAGTVYEVAVWAHTVMGDSPTALSHQQTAGVQPERPLLKSRPLNQTAVECSWTAGGATVQVGEAECPAGVGRL